MVRCATKPTIERLSVWESERPFAVVTRTQLKTTDVRLVDPVAELPGPIVQPGQAVASGMGIRKSVRNGERSLVPQTAPSYTAEKRPERAQRVGGATFNSLAMRLARKPHEPTGTTTLQADRLRSISDSDLPIPQDCFLT